MTLVFFPYTPSFGIIPTPAAPDRREFIDTNNQLQNSRSISQTTGDFQLSANGHFVGMSAVKQQVYLAIATQYNSSAQVNFGQQFTSLKINTSTTDQQVSDLVNLALSQLISTNKIALNNVTVVDVSPGQKGIKIYFTDLVSKQAQQLQIGFQQLSNLPKNTGSI